MENYKLPEIDVKSKDFSQPIQNEISESQFVCQFKEQHFNLLPRPEPLQSNDSPLFEFPSRDGLLEALEKNPIFHQVAEIFKNYKLLPAEDTTNKLINLPILLHPTIAMLIDENFLDYTKDTPEFLKIIKIYCSVHIPTGNILQLFTDFVFSQAFPREESKIPISIVVDFLRYNHIERKLDDSTLLSLLEDYEYLFDYEKREVTEFLINNLWTLNISTSILLQMIDWDIVFDDLDEDEADFFVNTMICKLQESEPATLAEDWVIPFIEAIESNFDSIPIRKIMQIEE